MEPKLGQPLLGTAAAGAAASAASAPYMQLLPADGSAGPWGPRATPAATSAARQTRALLLGAGESPIDNGFEGHTEFERGVVEVREGSDTLDLSNFQGPLSGRATFRSWALVSGCTLSLVGIPYMLTKLTLVRRGELGICEWVNGKIRVLGPGWHLLETINTTITKAELTADSIEHGALKILRILPGNVGLGTANGQPVILGPGRHLINDPLFRFVRQESVTSTHVSVGTVHLITVQSGKVGLCTVDSTAHFLEPGRHNINNPRFTFVGFRESTDEHINVGSKHRILVPAGRIGCAWRDGEPEFLNPGRVYNIDSPTFRYVNSVSVTESVIVHGRLKLVTVKEGTVGISYDDGKLVILPPGLHKLEKPTHSLAGFLSVGQIVLPITEVTSMTSDNVGIAFDAAVSIRVIDPAKAVTMLCTSIDTSAQFRVKAMHDTIIQQAKLALSIIIGNNRLNATFKATTRTARGAAKPVFASDASLDKQAPLVASTAAGSAAGAASGGAGTSDDPVAADGESSDTSFKQHVHDVFMHAFSEQMERDCGIAVLDMSIEDIKIVNAELARAMAQGAVARTGLIKSQIDTEVSKTQALAEQQAEILRAEGKARALRLTAAAEAERTRLAADAEAHRISAIAAAEAARIKTLDEALAAASAISQQREIVRASGEVLRESKTSLLLAHSTSDVASLLGARGGAGSLLSSA